MRGLTVMALLLIIGAAVAVLPDNLGPAVSAVICCIAGFGLGWLHRAATAR